MRNLTIKRIKSYVGCLAKIRIYIEDPVSNEITINNTPCRKIGDLKNGEEKTFQIEEYAAKVFVIADKLSKSFCNEYYQLYEGSEDIFLTGKNHFNPATGNAFKFDNNDSIDVTMNRKRNTRKGLWILTISAILGGIIGYSITSGILVSKTPEIKTFSSDGMTITLTDEFRETFIENYTVAYDSRNVAIFALEEEFALADGFENNSLEQYADLIIQSNNINSAEVKKIDGLTYFEYDFINPETLDSYKYFSYVYKTNDAFWLVQFATLSENVEKYEPQIIEWAKSVKFNVER